MCEDVDVGRSHLFWQMATGFLAYCCLCVHSLLSPVIHVYPFLWVSIIFNSSTSPSFSIYLYIVLNSTLSHTNHSLLPNYLHLREGTNNLSKCVVLCHIVCGFAVLMHGGILPCQRPSRYMFKHDHDVWRQRENVNNKWSYRIYFKKCH